MKEETMNIHLVLSRAKFAAPLAAFVLIGAPGAGLPGHASADDTTASGASGLVPSFNWSVQTPDGISEAGYSADIPDAVALAEIGMPQADDAMIAAAVT